MSYRHFDQHILSLLHFDYPYYAEPNDGLNDEILGTVWARSGNLKLAGSEIPADTIINGTPKFGYRCLYSQAVNDYAYAINDIFTLDASSSYEVSCYVRPAASQSGNIFALFNNDSQTLALTLNNNLTLSANCPAWNLNLTSSQTLMLNTWHSIALRISPSQCSIIIDGTSDHTDITRTPLTASSCRLGGFNGFIDEFMFRDSFSTSLPSQPVQAVLNASELGGFSNGSVMYGHTTLTYDCTINSYASCTVGSDKSYITLSNVSTGIFGGLQDYREIMILNNETGDYEFRELRSVTGNSAKVVTPVTISGNELQVISVPHFLSLTIPENVTVSPAAFSNGRGGVVIFRVKGDCTINGKIITSGLGRTRTDNMQLTHAKLIDNFLLTSGGNTMIFCGGTFTASSTARIGASWSGGGKGGAPVYRGNGEPGGAGYGGAGGSDVDTSVTGGNGGVGGGGGGADGAGGALGSGHGCDAGQPAGHTGGNLTTSASVISQNNYGGTQGVTAGGAGVLGGGGGAGGIGTGSTGRTVPAGANVVIITKTLCVDKEAVSTGGSSGLAENSGYQCGGGGTGFCFIAYEEAR